MPQNLRNIELFPLARADLEEIWLYTFNTWSLEQADSYHRKIANVFEALANGRKKGRKVDYIRQGYFRFPVGSHFIFYRQAQSGIEVVRILHQRMDIEQHL